MLFAGLYRLGAGPEWLLAAQAGLVGAAAVPLFYATRRLARSSVAALLVAVAFLLNPSLHAALDFDVHPELLGFFFVFTALYLLAADRPVASLVAVAPVLLLKEDMAALAAAFGVLVWTRGRRREGLALAGVSIACALATVFVLMPMARGGGSDLNERFQYLIEDTTLVTLVPVVAWRAASHLVAETVPAAMALIGTTGGISLLHPAALLAAPAAVLNGLADHEQQSRLDLQYAVAPLALLFVSAALALGDVARGRGALRRFVPATGGARAVPALAAMAFAAAAIAFFGWSPYAPGRLRDAPAPAHRQVVAEALTLVPDQANVSAQNTLLPHLSHRREIYEFPDVREETEYVIVDATLPITQQSQDAGYDHVLAELPDWGFGVTFDRDGIKVFARSVRR